MAQKTVYKLLFSYEAPDILKSKTMGSPITEFFNEGDVVIGEFYKKRSVIVDDRYIFPLDYLEKTNEFPYLKKESKFDETVNRIKQQAVILSEKEEEKLNQFGDNIKSTIEGRKVEKVRKESQVYKNGLLFGLGIGIVSALYFKKNIWILSIIGASLGGYVAYKLNEAKQGNNTLEPSV